LKFADDLPYRLDSCARRPFSEHRRKPCELDEQLRLWRQGGRVLLESVGHLGRGHGSDGRASPERVKVDDKRAQDFELAHAALVRRRHARPPDCT
jgi:hypothetical protein